MAVNSDLTYTTARGEVFNLGRGDARRFGEDHLRSHEWNHRLGRRGLSGVSASAKTVKIYIRAAAERMDAIRRAMDADTAKNTPGVLELAGWRQRALLVASVALSTRGVYTAELDVALLDGFWQRERTFEFLSAAASVGETGLDLPCDLPHDLGLVVSSSEFTAHIARDAEVRLMIFGPCVNPAITIDKNRYAIDKEIPAGARVEIDGASWPRTIKLVGIDGQTTDMFGAGHRSSGIGSGEYIFEPLHPTIDGVHQVESDGSFSFSLTICERDSEPCWGGEQIGTDHH